jgi:hypothetical protein
MDGESHACQQAVARVQEKSLPLAIGLNLVLPGLGYMYMGRVVLGIAAMFLIVLMFLSTGLLFLVPTWIGVNAIMAIDMLILFNKRKATVLNQSTKKCPYCAEVIQRDAVLCRFCHSKVSA